MMSTVGQQQSILPALKRLWAMGGMRAYYRGFTVRHLTLNAVQTPKLRLLNYQLAVVGVFPYSGECLEVPWTRALMDNHLLRD